MSLPDLPLPTPGQRHWAEPLNASLEALNDALGAIPTTEELDDAVTAAETARDQAQMYAANTQDLQDQAVTSIFNNTSSQFREALNESYADESVQTTVEEGRLSPPQLGDTIGRGVNVLSYGAKGDGVTDDTAAIQAAIDAAESFMQTPGVFFPSDARTYIISSSLVISAKWFTLSAGLRTPSQFRPIIKGAFPGPLLISKAQGVTIGNISFRGDYVSQGDGSYDGLVTYGIVMDRTDSDEPAADIDSAIVGCSFHYLRGAVHVVGRNLDFIDNLVAVSGFGVKVDAYGTATGLDECRGHRFLNNRFHTIGWGMGTVLDGVDYSAGIIMDSRAFGNQILGNFVDGGSSTLYRGPIDRTMINSNHMYNMIGAGIDITGGGTGWEINGNTYAGIFNSGAYLPAAQRTPDSFVQMLSGALVDGCINNNVIINTRKHGINIAEGSSITVNGNHIRDAGVYWAQGDGHVYDGIYIGAGNNAVITGNVIRSSSVGGEITHRYGINTGTSANAIVTGNRIASAYTAAYNVEAPSSRITDTEGVTTTSGALNSVSNAINSVARGKRTGQRVFCTDHSGGARPHWASGFGATSPWVNADGTTAHSPA